MGRHARRRIKYGLRILAVLQREAGNRQCRDQEADEDIVPRTIRQLASSEWAFNEIEGNSCYDDCDRDPHRKERVVGLTDRVPRDESKNWVVPEIEAE